MTRRGLLSAFVTLMTAVIVSQAHAAPSAELRGGPDDLRAALYRRFPPSQIEVQNQARKGAVTRQGRLLIVAADGVPAKPFRVVEVGGTRRARQHVMDFARVDITEDGTIRGEPAPLTVHRGTRVVVLDIELGGDEVRLLTHTAEPLGARPGGDEVYGCTEFVFHLDPAILAAGSVEPIASLIERWLLDTLMDRTCRAGVREICIEP